MFISLRGGASPRSSRPAPCIHLPHPPPARPDPIDRPRLITGCGTTGEGDGRRRRRSWCKTNVSAWNVSSVRQCVSVFTTTRWIGATPPPSSVLSLRRRQRSSLRTYVRHRPYWLPAPLAAAEPAAVLSFILFDCLLLIWRYSCPKMYKDVRVKIKQAKKTSSMTTIENNVKDVDRKSCQ